MITAPDDPREPVRALPVPGVWGYVDELGVPPGEVARFRVNAPGAYDFSVVRLGVRAILDPDASEADDRADVEVLSTSVHSTATPQQITPGSYVYVDGEAIPGYPLTLSAWLRPWRLPSIDAVQWAWQGIVSDLDYPYACRFGLLVDHTGRLAVYAGDGGVFRHAWLHVTPATLQGRLGQWLHLAASIDTHELSLFVNGERVYHAQVDAALGPPGPAARLRLGATGEAGEAANFLDGDLAAPFVGAFTLTEDQAALLAGSLARRSVDELAPGALHAWWPLDEETGTHVHDASGHARHGQIVNHATWQIGGPAHDPAGRALEYDPTQDADRGHGLRLCSDDLVDCGWSETDSWQVPASAPSGMYAGRVCLVGQDPSTALSITFAVVCRRPRASDSIALVLATNTWFAYGRRPTNELMVAGLSSSFYSNHTNGRPFFHLGTHVPIPRADPYRYESARAARQHHSHLVRPERFAQAWLSEQGYPFEVLTDADLHADPGCLDNFRAVMFCGHNEYWSDRMRDGVDGYLSRGGQVLALSGNTLCWRVSFDATQTVIESRKTVSGEDARWLAPDRWGERWHADDAQPGGAWVQVGRPGYKVLGLDSQGMVDDGTPTSFAAFQVLRPDHFLFTTPERVPLSASGTIGERNLNGPRASGYEFDATPDTIGLTEQPLVGMEVLASALGQRNIEAIGRDTQHGGDIVYWQRPDGGQVINAGSIGFTGALAVDAGVQALVRNALAHFGIHRSRGT